MTKTLQQLLGSSVAAKPESSENGSAIETGKKGLDGIAKSINESAQSIGESAQSIREDTEKIRDLNTEVCSAYLMEDGTPRDFSDREGRETMCACIEGNTMVLEDTKKDFVNFKDELLNKIPEHIDAKLTDEHVKLLNGFYRNRGIYLATLIFFVVSSVAFTVLYGVKVAAFNDKSAEFENWKKEKQTYIDFADYMRDNNPKTWKRWQNGEIEYPAKKDKSAN